MRTLVKLAGELAAGTLLLLALAGTALAGDPESTVGGIAADATVQVGGSVSIGADRVIRYSAVVKSPSGATSTSYEAMRCKTSEYRIYAFGVAGGWAASRNSKWQQIPRATGDFRFTLYKDYFCDSEAIAGQSEKELIGNLTGNLLKSPPDRNR